MTFPKIELHVHLEGTVRAATLLQIAKRNDVSLPVATEGELRQLYEFTGFAHFARVWQLTTGALRRDRDFRQVLVDYAAEAASHGAVYLEGIIAPSEQVARGASWDEVYTGYCDGVQEAVELHGVHVRLTPDVNRSYPVEAAELTARYAVAYAGRGVVGIGLGGQEAEYPPEPFARAFAQRALWAAATLARAAADRRFRPPVFLTEVPPSAASAASRRCTVFAA